MVKPSVNRPRISARATRDDGGPRLGRAVAALLLAAWAAACGAEFATDPALVVTVHAQAGWRDTFAVQDQDTLGVGISTSDGVALAGLEVRWVSSDAAVLVLAPMPPAGATRVDSLAAQLSVRATALARGRVEVTVTVDRAGFAPTVFSDSVAVLERWIAVTAGDEFACGLTVSRDAYCWGGSNLGGRSLGNGSEFGSPIPVLVLGGLKFASIAAGQLQACAITHPTGQPYCWGENHYGALGDGSTDDQLVPSPVVGGRTFRSLRTGGRASCGITVTAFGTTNAMCWGRLWPWPEPGRVNNDPLKPDFVNVAVLDSIAVGWRHACGIAQSGTTWCWGDHALGGRLGTGSVAGPATCNAEDAEIDLLYGPTFPCATSPVTVAGGTRFRALSAGATHTCGLSAADGTAYCWGDNRFGQLGDGTTTDRPAPVPVLGGRRFVAITAAGDIRQVERWNAHTCAIGTDSLAYCWGDNRFGQLGLGSTAGPEQCVPFILAACSTQPRAVAGGLTFVALSAGAGGPGPGLLDGVGFTCGVRPAGALYCWGGNVNGKLGNPAVVGTSSVPVRVREPATP